MLSGTAVAGSTTLPPAQSTIIETPKNAGSNLLVMLYINPSTGLSDSLTVTNNGTPCPTPPPPPPTSPPPPPPTPTPSLLIPVTGGLLSGPWSSLIIGGLGISLALLGLGLRLLSRR